MTKTRRIAAAVLFAFLPAAVGVPQIAFAQDDPTTVQARARFKEGVDAYDKGKFEEARLLFLQAYTLKKHPSLLFNLAQSSAKSGHYLDASRYFQQFLKEGTPTPQQKKDAESGLADVRQKVARIEVVAPAGTDISMDDQGKVGTAPFEALDVEPGQHTLKSPTQSVTVIATMGQKVEARFGKEAAAPPPVAPVPTPKQEPPPQQEPPQQPAPADEGTKKHSNVFSEPESWTPIAIGLGAAGVGLVGAILFAVFKADAQQKADSVASTIRTEANARGIQSQGICNNTASNPDFAKACNTLRDNNSKVDTDATIANVSLVVMGVGLLTAGIWYLAGPKKDDAKSSSKTFFTPYADGHGGGFMTVGRF